MGLSSALYAGTSGLEVHGEKMSVIGNNLANVNTVGFKKSNMYFEDALYQSITTSSGTGQVGRGVAISTVMSDFSQGSMESTSESTDMAIGGDGFFIVSPKGEETQYYTRAGNFRFDEDGYLVDPHGYVVQGWEVAQEDTSVAASGSSISTSSTGVQTEGVPTDIVLENFQSPPQATAQVNVVTNLDSRSEDKATSASNPFFALFSTWDGTSSTPMPDNKFTYQSTIKVYDQNGTPHNLTVYYDPVSDNISNTGGKQYWEFLVTVDPSEDNRTFWSSATTTRTKGILMTGTLTFNSSGQLEGMSAFTLRDTNASSSGVQFADGTTEPDNMANWLPAQFNQDGYPLCTANFRGVSDADTTNQTDAKNIAIDFGARNKDLSNAYSTYPYFSGWDSGSLPTGQSTSIDDVGAYLSNLPNFNDFELEALSTTNYSTGSTTVTQSQDGYTAGFLQNITVDRDGVMTGRYSNGQILNLYVITLADFNNTQGLNREGGNLFSETRSSGAPLTGLPNTGGLGSIASNSLEQSNVDMSEEFVDMIITQKGFQANSRTITTTDDMLQEVVNLKR